MRLAKAYRSLPRPSSVLEPSYPLNGLQSLVLVGLDYRRSFNLTPLTYQTGLLPELSFRHFSTEMKKFWKRRPIFRGRFELRCLQLLSRTA